MSTLLKNKSIKSKSVKSKSVKEKSKSVKEKSKSVKNDFLNHLINKYVTLLKNKKEVPCVETSYKINKDLSKKVDYRLYKNFISKLKEKKDIVNVKNENINKIQMCKVNAYNKYLKKVNAKGLFMNLRKYHQNIKSNYINKYAFNTDLLMDVGSSQLKSMRFWNSARVKKVVAMEPSLELFDLGMIYLRKDFYGRRHVTFLRGVGEKSWLNGEGGLNDFASKYLMNMIKNNVKASAITFEFTFHYMIYNMKVLMENIKSVSKSGTKVIIHCINGDFLMNVFKEKNKYEVIKDNEVVFYAEKDFENESKNQSKSKSKSSSKSKSQLLNLKKVNIFFSGAQGLNNIISEYLVIKDDIVKIFEKYGFKLIEFTPFSEQNFKNFGLEGYEFDVSKIYTTYVFECV
jgi:hypothetical protein